MSRTQWWGRIRPTNLVLKIAHITSHVWLVGRWGAIYFSGKGGSLFPNKIREGNLAGQLRCNLTAVVAALARRRRWQHGG